MRGRAHVMALARFAHLGREELDRQLSPSRSAKDPWGVLRRHEAVSAALEVVDGITVRRDLPYGNRPAERLDLVVPAGRGPCPCVVWFHGGFWQEGSKAGSCFAALPLARAGIALAGVGYTLAPELRLGDIVREASAALMRLHTDAASYGLAPGRFILAGHSAGAHLAAAVLCGQGGPEVAPAIAGAVLVSGVYDLAPIAVSYVNDRARLDDDDVLCLSPMSLLPYAACPVHVLVGADEPDLFKQQSAALAFTWMQHHVRVSQHEAPGRDHFDVLDELIDRHSPTFRAIVEMTS